MKTPRPYQQEAIEHIGYNNNYLCDACGLGKTLVSIESVKLAGDEYRKALVVCPKTARVQWMLAIMEQIPDANVIVTEHLPYRFDDTNAWFITSFDELTPRSLLYPVARVVWPTIIIDEAHRLRNHSTARSKNITKLWGAHKIALSATPIEKHGGELWPLLKWLAPGKFPSYWKWVNDTFEVKPGHFGGMDIGDPLNLIDYQSQVMPYIIRRTKEQVAPDLPERIDIPVYLTMDKEQSDIYNEIYEQKDVLVEIEDVKLLISNALTLFTRLQQVSVLPSLIGSEATSSKMSWLKEFIQDHQDMRLLVYSRYREVVDYVYRTFNDYGVSTVVGGLDESERFKAGEGRILAGTIDAMSESLSLEMADAAIFLDQHLSATKMHQAVDRIHRMNITDRKFIYYLISSPADRRAMDVVEGKYTDQEMLLEFIGHGE